MSKIRISNSLESKYNIPAVVADTMRKLAAEYRIASASVSSRPAYNASGLLMTAGEGERITVISPDGRVMGLEMVAEHNVGAVGVFHGIGQEFRIPVGAWIITVWYYAGYGMTVNNVGFAQIA